jgi:thioredoxin reductase
MTTDPDVIIIGGGAGGLTTATRAARTGASVTLVADGGRRVSGPDTAGMPG